jgi:hypothetical protein
VLVAAESFAGVVPFWGKGFPSYCLKGFWQITSQA